MLSAKTNTTCRDKDTNGRHDFNADGVPKAPQLILLPPADRRTSRVHTTALSAWSQGQFSAVRPRMHGCQLCTWAETQALTVTKCCRTLNYNGPFKSAQAPYGSR